jgi:hypothetical protein
MIRSFLFNLATLAVLCTISLHRFSLRGKKGKKFLSNRVNLCEEEVWVCGAKRQEYILLESIARLVPVCWGVYKQTLIARIDCGIAVFLGGSSTNRPTPMEVSKPLERQPPPQPQPRALPNDKPRSSSRAEVERFLEADTPTSVKNGSSRSLTNSRGGISLKHGDMEEDDDTKSNPGNGSLNLVQVDSLDVDALLDEAETEFENSYGGGDVAHPLRQGRGGGDGNITHGDYTRVSTSEGVLDFKDDDSGLPIFPTGNGLQHSVRTCDDCCCCCCCCLSRQASKTFCRGVCEGTQWLQWRVLILFLCGMMLGSNVVQIVLECLVVGAFQLAMVDTDASHDASRQWSLVFVVWFVLGGLGHLVVFSRLCRGTDGKWLGIYVNVLFLATIGQTTLAWLALFSDHPDGSTTTPTGPFASSWTRIWSSLQYFRALTLAALVVANALVDAVVYCKKRPRGHRTALGLQDGCLVAWSGSTFATETMTCALEFALVGYGSQLSELSCDVYTRLGIALGVLSLGLAMWSLAMRAHTRDRREQQRQMFMFVVVYFFELMAILAVDFVPTDVCSDTMIHSAAYLRHVLLILKILTNCVLLRFEQWSWSQLCSGSRT